MLNMRYRPAMFAFAALAAAAGFGAETRVDALPPSAFADTEVSTNVVFDATRDRAQFFDIELELTALANNSVVVSFGTDADGDGVLSLGESDLEVGWRCGAWFMRDRRGGASERTLRTPGRRTLNWRTRILFGATTRFLGARDADGEVFPFAESGFFDPAWNLVRVTARGTAAQSVVVASLTSIGMRISIR